MKIAVVGDIHEQWNADDREALAHLGVDLVLLVGDFGNESIPIVTEIAALEIPFAAILGNHDAWYSASKQGRKESPYKHHQENRVDRQLALLGDNHVGYSKKDFPQWGISVVGSRPFSWGGQDWKNSRFYQERYQVKNFQESTSKILAAVQKTTENTLIFLGHSGPLGLGDRPDSPCGRDWLPLGGDFGDPDFADAIKQTRVLGKQIPLVAFGHTHHQLRYSKTHRRTPLVVSAEGTIYLNGACVPRIQQRGSKSYHHFSLVSLERGKVVDVSLVWVNKWGEVGDREILYVATPTPQQLTPV